MPRVNRVYITRHGTRQDFLTKTFNSPTGLSTDPPLADVGFLQGRQLADHLLKIAPGIKHIVSSPFTRCLQTIEPFARATGMKIKIEPGLGEWFNAWELEPKERSPPQIPPLQVTMDLFPGLIDEHYLPCWRAGYKWESEDQLHERCAWVAQELVSHLEGLPAPAVLDEEDVEVLFVTHAACQIALSRAFVGDRKAAVHCGVASLNRFSRAPNGQAWVMEAHGEAHYLDGGLQHNWAFWNDRIVETDQLEKGRL
ncbi:histidine phosphatase superfamily [Gaertneriomyces semiglobifer]|nr:histidine phosphatase superfamily [Gaertneriomyces semiglobifer]